VEAAVPAGRQEPGGGRRAPVHLRGLPARARALAAHHQCHRASARGVQAAHQDPVPAALCRDRRHAVVGAARFGPDHPAPGRRLADPRSATRRRLTSPPDPDPMPRDPRHQFPPPSRHDRTCLPKGRLYHFMTTTCRHWGYDCPTSRRAQPFPSVLEGDRFRKLVRTEQLLDLSVRPDQNYILVEGEFRARKHQLAGTFRGHSVEPAQVD
jgi:hypothetical protein